MLGFATGGRGAGSASAPSAAPAWTVKTLEEVALACGTRSAQLRRCLEASAEQRTAAEDGTRMQAVLLLHESAATRSKCEKLALDLMLCMSDFVCTEPARPLRDAGYTTALKARATDETMRCLSAFELRSRREN